MNKIGLFYKTDSSKTAIVAKKIMQEFGKNIEVIPVDKAWKKEFESYDNMIIGSSTWFDGELPTYWDELIPELETMNLKNKKVAIFGLGDQINYSDNFVDGIGILAEALEKSGATIVGCTPLDGYHFTGSRALRDNQLLGLAIDIENQSAQTDKRIKAWTAQLKQEFE